MHTKTFLIEKFVHYLRFERHFSPYTARCYEADLRQFVEYLDGGKFVPGQSLTPTAAERAPDLARDAAVLVRRVHATWAAGGEIYWLSDGLRRDGRGARAVLPERLERQLGSAGIGLAAEAEAVGFYDDGFAVEF